MTLRRLLGAALVLATYVPVHRLLDPSRAGPAGRSTRAAAEAAWSVGLYGTVIVVGAAVALSLLVPAGRLSGAATAVADLLSRPRGGVFAGAVSLVAGGLSLSIALALYRGLPTSVDEMAQLLHAQALTGGRLGIPLPGDPTAWTIQNSVITPEGWASIYPPFHTVLLALGLAIGAPWIVGPLAVSIATCASALAFEEVLGRRTGRVAALVLALSPFWLLLGATYLSHTTAAAGVALVLWTGLRAPEGGLRWALACGAAIGVSVAARPWIGLVSATALLVALWWPRRERLRLPALMGGVVAGGLPFAALLLWWNDRLFGSGLRLGYSAAFGPSHSLGFHVDPWGNVYGPREALAYTGADLTQLGAHLLETPLPAVALVGVALIAGMRAMRPLLTWVVAALAANALYWHHGIHMGPRMLFEAVPAWVALLTAAAAYLVGDDSLSPTVRRVSGWAVATAAVGAVALAPGALSSAARSAEATAYASLPDIATEEPALVFVHGSWSSRVVARLVATGMRRDSVETALRRNDICAVDRYTRWREADPAARVPDPPRLDLRPLPGTPAALQRASLSPGNDVWMASGSLSDPACLRQAVADRQGVMDLEPLIWQAPPLPGRDVVVARDMGSETNALVSSALDGRRTYVYAPLLERGPSPVLMSYDEGMRVLWSADGGAP